MTRYLFAAEADKIQDFIFRSARLREVAKDAHRVPIVRDSPVPPDRHVVRFRCGERAVTVRQSADGRWSLTITAPPAQLDAALRDALARLDQRYPL